MKRRNGEIITLMAILSLFIFVDHDSIGISWEQQQEQPQ